MNHDAVSKVILDSAFRIHSRLRAGLFEYVYELILALRTWETASP